MNKVEEKLLNAFLEPMKDELQRLRIENKELKEQNKELVNVITEICLSKSKNYSGSENVISNAT